jgi:hypothetical protein
MASSSRTPRPRRRLKARSAAVQQPVAEFVRKNPAERSCHQQPRQGFRPRPRAHAADERLRPRHAHKDDEPCPATNGTHPSAESWVRSSGALPRPTSPGAGDRKMSASPALTATPCRCHCTQSFLHGRSVESDRRRGLAAAINARSILLKPVACWFLYHSDVIAVSKVCPRHH